MGATSCALLADVRVDWMLKHMKRLRSLHLNNIVTLFHLHRLIQLTSVHIESKLAPDFEPMAGLTNLQLLSIEKCRCGHLRPISGEQMQLLLNQARLQDLTLALACVTDPVSAVKKGWSAARANTVM